LIVLDTDVLIEIFDKESKRGDETLARIESTADEVWTTVLNLHEILYGCLRSSRPVDRLLGLDALPFTLEDAKLSSKIEAGLEKKGSMVERMDTMIAATVINSGGKICTYDLKHFERMEEFGLEFFS
jgi:predicted nucleic acid-binding protein